MTDDGDRWLRRVERERAARKEAERLLEEKSLALYNANRDLHLAARELEKEVAERTTELREALAQANAATRAKGNFLAAMSHEIRTPMNGILGIAELLQSSALSAEQRKHVDVIRSSGDALLVLINDILDFSKIEAGRLDLEERDFNLHDALGHTFTLFRPSIQKKGLQLEVKLAASLPRYVCGDSGRIQQIFTNLLSNAIKFTASGRILVDVTGSADGNGDVRLNCRVQDSGIGIPADRQDRLFRAFSQVDSSTTRQYGGTGLGLVICARLVAAMGGSIRVESEPGQGSTFEFSVALKQGAAPAPTARSLPPSGAGLTDLKVLVAEDNKVNQMLVMTLLDRMGVCADLVGDGAQAVERVRNGAYDMVLMDMQMPVMDGLAATRVIRQLTLPTQPFIIALTANAFDSDRELCLEAGMDDFLTKPFRADQLKDKLTAFRRPV